MIDLVFRCLHVNHKAKYVPDTPFVTLLTRVRDDLFEYDAGTCAKHKNTNDLVSVIYAAVKVTKKSTTIVMMMMIMTKRTPPADNL